MSSYTRQFAINGVIDTNKTVMQNMNTLASAAGSWVTFDVNAGLWSVVINQPGTSVKSFTDANIIGAITITNTGLTELYNSVELEFPHKDLLDRVDTITFTIPEINRYDNEQPNTLNFQFDCINDPVQAELLAARELKQSRVDQVIQFSTDFTSLGLKAGDLIDITSSIYGFSEKLYRILTIAEEDGANGEILLNITAYEYSSSVFSTEGLEREVRTTQNDISSECANTALQNSNNAEAAGKTANGLALLTPALLTTLLGALGRRVTGGTPGNYTYSPGLLSQVISYNFTTGFPGDLDPHTFYTGREIIAPYTGTYKMIFSANWGANNLPAPPPIGVQKGTFMQVRLNNGAITDITDTGDPYGPAFEDHYLEGFFTASQGDSIKPYATYVSNVGSGWYDPAGYPTFTMPSGAEPFVLLTVTLQYVGE